jgi:hypothetical protein
MTNGNLREPELVGGGQQPEHGVCHATTLVDACFDVGLPL